MNGLTGRLCFSLPHEATNIGGKWKGDHSRLEMFVGSLNALQAQGTSVSCFKIDATNMVIQNSATEIR
jgi:hypothetical protein